MGSSESKVAIVVLLGLLSIAIIVILLRICRKFSNFENQQEPSTDDQIKSQLIQMAILNTTAITMQPITVRFSASGMAEAGGRTSVSYRTVSYKNGSRLINPL